MLDTKLYTLLKVAETGSFTGAAKALNLTQPAISQHILALENELGVKLFERAGNRIILTKQGEKAVNTAKMMKGLYQNLKNELAERMSGVEEINIGITHTVESNRITEVLARYASENTGITIKLFTGTQAKIRRKLKNYELDLAIVDGSFQDNELKSRQLDVDQLVLITDPSHPLSMKKDVTINDVKHEKLILRLPDSGTANMFKSGIESQDLPIEEFNVILEVDNVATIKSLIRSGYGVSVLPRSACLNELRKKKLVARPIENLNMTRVINFAYPEDTPYAEFMDEIMHLYEEI